jgi:ATP-dependent exoDNAse (exonuclease V) beta subunit
MLCLTVFEAKGLEFDDVVLYNFFNSGEIQTGSWKLINDIHFTEDTDQEMDAIVQGLQNLLVTEVMCDRLTDKDKRKNNRENNRMVNKNTLESSYVYRKFASLCIELKMLYVAITRPKKRLIIYDDDVKARLPI